jgi:predicted AlkP superfamily phosphohydrolase/phosphomutase
MLTGYGTPRTESTQFTYPEEFAQHLPPELHSEIRVALPKNKFDRSQAFIDEWTEVMRGRSKMLTHLIQAGKWDLFMVVFSITDNMAHVFWTYVDPEHPNYYKPEAEMYREAFYHSYEMCDAILGELMSRAGDDTTTLILSDHGFGSVRPRQYIFKRYFEGKFLFPKQSSSRFGVINEFLAKTAVNTYTKFPFLREWIKGMSPGQREGVRQALNKAGYIPSLNASDLTRSKIIPANLGSRIWINEIGRFSQGIVPSSEKESLMQELQDFLLSDIDPITNQQIVSDVFRGKDLYQGEFSHMAPDLIIEYTNSYKPVNETEIRNPHTEGGHTLDGVFLAYGPNIQKTAVSDASLIDLAPTILHLFNQPIPPDMDGQVLTTIFTKEYQVKHPIILGEKPARKDTIQENTEFSATEEAELNDQLRQLGYIE